MKKAKAIVLALVAGITVGLLFFLGSPVPEMEKGIGPLQPVYIVLSALAGIILLVIFVKYFKAIMRSVVDNLRSIITIVVAGVLVFMLVYVSWPVEIAMKVELLRSVFIASLALVGFVTVIPVRLIRSDGDFSAKLGISDIGIKNLRTAIYRSAALGCLAILAIVLYFIIDEINLFFIAWLFFILQLGLLIFPLIFARIIVFR